MKFHEKITLDDILIVPGYSEIETRKNIDISNWLGKDIHCDIPIISSPMTTISEEKMCIEMYYNGGLGILHRFNSIKEQCKMVERIKKVNNNILFGAAIGVKKEDIERAIKLYQYEVVFIVIDIAHAHSILVERMIKSLRDSGIGCHIMAGSIATKQAYIDLCQWGVDSVKVGIGPGSICQTRAKTGCGYPLAASLIEIVEEKKNLNIPICVDGGMKTPGDITKCLALGADFIITGRLLTGTDETPGEIITKNNKKYKLYAGMASKVVQNNKKDKTYSIEGVSKLVKYKGSVKNVIENIVQNIKSGFSYVGANNLKELREKAKFVRISQASYLEGLPHIKFVK